MTKDTELGTVTYDTDKLRSVVSSCDTVVSKAVASSASEWSDYEEKVQAEANTVSRQVDLLLLKHKYVDILTELTTLGFKRRYVLQPQNFLGFKWSKKVLEETVVKTLSNFDLAEEVVRRLDPLVEDTYPFVRFRITYKHGKALSDLPLLERRLMIGYVDATCDLDQLHVGNCFSGRFYISVERVDNNLVAPDPIDKFKGWIETLNKLNSLANLPDAKEVTLSSELVVGLHNILELKR